MSVDVVVIPSRIHDVERPVPVPSSRNFPLGFDAARVRRSEPVRRSDAMVKPDVRVAVSMSVYWVGRLGIVSVMG